MVRRRDVGSRPLIRPLIRPRVDPGLILDRPRPRAEIYVPMLGQQVQQVIVADRLATVRSANGAGSGFVPAALTLR